MVRKQGPLELIPMPMSTPLELVPMLIVIPACATPYPCLSCITYLQGG